MKLTGRTILITGGYTRSVPPLYKELSEAFLNHLIERGSESTSGGQMRCAKTISKTTPQRHAREAAAGIACWRLPGDRL
jgi:hypothetical protein